ncbi:hypothetical protein F5148DRAFT_843120 [Russula earlei]|uniref:Uncharacterized protein n=1 Tax=Russula earlei TaxID=71964 RepID=A0ACC0UB26_9AGAM|nr:hypothetical protein F5148DRAFT_843120 [Russula earlei]
MVFTSPTPSFPGAWPDPSSSDLVPPLPDRPDTLEDDDPPQDISPSLLFLSPRPLPELPSLSSSLSTTDSSVTNDLATPPEQPSTLPEVQQACTPLQVPSPIILDLREPGSPDSALFSPTDDSVSFASPSTSQLRLSLTDNYRRSQSVESVATYLVSHISPPTPDVELGHALQDEENRPDPPIDEMMDLCLPDAQQERPLHGAKISVGNRTFLSRVKRFGGRVRKLFKPRTVETKPRRNSVSSLVTPRKSLHAVSVRLTAAIPESPRENPRSRRGSWVPNAMSSRFSLQSLRRSRPPPESPDFSSCVAADNRLSTFASTHYDGWPLPQNRRLSGAALAEGSGIVHARVHPDRVLQGLGIGEQESVESPDPA